ncbi:MAG: phosphatase PAP2 family protein [Bacteroidales bacterium]|nr:phosphatase PAP2 family protein [Bacteroidales bacterium]
MFKFLKDFKIFLLPYTVFLILATPVIVLFSKEEVHIFLNRHFSPFFDEFFKTLTFLGSGIFVLGIGIIAMLFSFRKSLFIIFTYLGTGLFVQVLKRLVFTDVVRPTKFFEGIYPLHLVDGVKLYAQHSFPSGHAASAFGLFLCLAMMTRNRSIQFLFFIFSLLVAYSRIYLSQHFLIDIYFGSIIGVAGAVLFYYTVFMWNKTWLNFSLLTLIRKKK